MNDFYDDYNNDYYEYLEEFNNNTFNEFENNSNFLESILSINKVSNSLDNNEQYNKKKYSLFDFQRRNLINIKEEFFNHMNLYQILKIASMKVK